MSEPVFVPLHTGDVHDDDAQVIDRMLNDSTEPPAPYLAPVPVTPLIEPERCTRLRSGDLTVLTTWGPTLILPADAKRKNFYLRVQAIDATPSAATDWVVVTDEPGKPAGKIRHGQDMNMIGHTGPVYIDPSGTRVTMAVSYWAVTE